MYRALKQQLFQINFGKIKSVEFSVKIKNFLTSNTTYNEKQI